MQSVAQSSYLINVYYKDLFKGIWQKYSFIYLKVACQNRFISHLGKISSYSNVPIAFHYSDVNIH